MKECEIRVLYIIFKKFYRTVLIVCKILKPSVYYIKTLKYVHSEAIIYVWSTFTKLIKHSFEVLDCHTAMTMVPSIILAEDPNYPNIVSKISQ